MSKQTTGQPAASDAPPAAEARAADSPQSMIDDLLKLYRSPPGKGASPEITDAVTQVLVVGLASGPSVAGARSMTAGAEALALLFHNAVAQQQKTNIEALAVTADCVAKILGAPAAATAPTGDGTK
jgi:hypothetical protein